MPPCRCEVHASGAKDSALSASPRLVPSRPDQVHEVGVEEEWYGPCDAYRLAMLLVMLTLSA